MSCSEVSPNVQDPRLCAASHPSARREPDIVAIAVTPLAPTGLWGLTRGRVQVFPTGYRVGERVSIGGRPDPIP
ncbi:hypothetical protein A7K94_0214295 [Modestobacter sp. VKM Ac-2676]|nr:hypothetical protein A7K94_0214295 [Modestobacter sp. VKM Ac-2676]